MATATLLQHPSHKKHPLEHRDFRKDLFRPPCYLCCWKISSDGYACEECRFYVHRVCAEAPPQIDAHPLHTDHPLTLTHRRPPPFKHKFCNLCNFRFTSMFMCEECDFCLDIRCALSTLSDRGGSQGKTPEQITLPFHIHRLTSFSNRHDFIGDSNCVICKESVEGDGYTCLYGSCEFLIHKRCVQDLFYVDGTKAPRVFHQHPLETFLGEDMGSSRCAKCRSNESREFIGCASCQLFYCRDCVQVPESIQYPHHPDHNLVLFIISTDNDRPQCVCCLVSMEDKLCYGCPSCEFFVDVGCALQVLAYCEEGLSAEIKLSWHEHPLHLCHRTRLDLDDCSYCEDNAAGPMYTCKEEVCRILLHKRCIEIESTVNIPHHPDHPLTLRQVTDYQSCGACCNTILSLYFSCELCAFYLHAKCAAHVPTRKHYLHEHELLHLKEAPLCKCNRCGIFTSTSLFRCVPCDFNLHEECMELPPKVLNSKVHWHSLTLHDIFLEDDTGEYYCEHCEKRRDGRLGVYVCGECKISLPRIYHIDCVLPELRKVYEKKDKTSIIRRFNKRIARKNEEVRAAEVKLEEVKRELDELKKTRDERIAGMEKDFESATEEEEYE